MIGLIVARSKNNVIGKNGNIPWKIKGEQKQFRELTTGNVVIMGRKSYEEIGHPLPNRMNIVVSTTTEYQGDNLVSVKSLEDALLLAKGRDVYISGGYGLFKEALQIVDKMYITEVDLNIEDGDTFFPEFDINDFEVLIGETLGEELENMPNNLSGGQQQRVAIARALITKPAIILADEPTGNLDSKTSADVLGLLKHTSGEFNQTIVMITHNNEIAQLADRIVRIEDGKIVG